MSSIENGPGGIGQREILPEQEHELEEKAERYSELHPDNDHPVETRPQRLVDRLLGALRRHSAE